MKRHLTGLFFAVICVFVVFSGCGSSSSTTDYPNSGLLKSGSWLAEHINDANLVIIDARSSADYGAGHITNAISLPHTSLNTTSTSTDLKSASDLSVVFGQNGISTSDTIVVYGSSSADYSADRVFWALEYLGHTDVHSLDGGYTKWTSDGRSTATTAATKAATTFTASVDETRLATKSYVSSNYSSSVFALVDSRNKSDYDTKHIPNAINLLVGDYLNSDNTVKSYADIAALLQSNNITTNKTVITYCYVGYRSAQAYFIYRLMGYTVRNYDGSWTEWSADSSLPTEP